MKNNALIIFTLLIFNLFMMCCQPDTHEKTIVKRVTQITDSAVVVTAHPLASDVGIAILKKGGNAIDAAVAVQFALAVVYPAGGNIGGGGFMVIRTNRGKIAALDYREMAPIKASEEMYLNKNTDVIEGKSEKGHLASGIPGTVAGMVKAHKKYGSLPWRDLIQPAINLAENGFPLTKLEAEGLNNIQEDLTNLNTIEPSFLIRNWSKGDTIKWSDLAKTLERIRDDTLKGFYSGKTADDIVAEMERGEGIITQEDLDNYEAAWRNPIEGNYRGYKIISMPPPSSGGVALIQMLKMLEPYPIREYGLNSAKSMHLMTEIERRVYADRAKHLGDPDFYLVPTQELLDTRYLKHQMKDFNTDKATLSSSIKPGEFTTLESEQTTHYSIVDAFGNAVAVTTTLNSSYGSRVIVAGSGFLLNNEMDDFSIKPGYPNIYGLIGGEANKIAPLKRMLSSMTPTIIEKNGKLFMVLGTPGGSTIITSVFQNIVNVIDHEMTMQESVNVGRFHHQWLPDTIFVEKNRFDKATINQLKDMGHHIKERSAIGRVDAIHITNNTKNGAADMRGDDSAKGY